MNQKIKLFVKSVFSKFGFQIQRVSSNVDHSLKLRSLWNEDEVFISLLKEVETYTLVDRIRCFIIYSFAKQARYMDGDVAEVGVYKGGTTKLISRVITGTNKTVHIFDTFQGMPPTDHSKDLYKEGDFSDTSLESVKEYLGNCNNVRFYQGIFSDTSGPVINLQFSFVHIDVDIYKSVLDCCKFFYPRMVKNGIMLFDDYGSLRCPGAKIPVDEFFSDKAEYPCYLPSRPMFHLSHWY